MTGVPSTMILPFVGIDFDSSQAQAGPEEMPINMLVIGQRLAAGTVAAEVQFTAFSAEEVAIKAGVGSMLHRMAKYIFPNNNVVPVTFIGLDDAEGTQATYAFTIAGTAIAVGTFACKIAGETYAVSVAVGDTETEVAAALVALITADVEIQVTAANTAGAVTLTCRNDGVIAGDLDVRFVSEALPAGITVGAVTPTAGTVDPDIADALAVVGDSWSNVVVNPYTDDTITTNVTTLKEWAVAQNNVLVQKDFLAYQIVRDTQAALITWADPSEDYGNCQFLATGMGYKRQPCTYELAAAIASIVAVSIQQKTSVPLHRMTPSGVASLDTNDRWNGTLRNQLARSGIFTLTDDNGVQTESMVTMYLKNEAGAASVAYQQQNTIFQLMKARYTLRNWILLKYPRALLANNADNVPDGVQVLTPKVAKDEAIAWFRYYQGDLFEGGEDAVTAFADAVTCTRVGANRMDWIVEPDLMNQFIVGSATIRFKL